MFELYEVTVPRVSGSGSKINCRPRSSRLIGEIIASPVQQPQLTIAGVIIHKGVSIDFVLLHSHRPHKSVAPVLESRVILIDHVPLGARLLAVVIAAIHATHDKDTLEILICAGSRSAVKAKTAHIATCSGGTFQIEKSSSIRRDSEAIIASALAV